MPSITLTIDGKLPGLNDYTGACRSHPQAGAAMKKKAEKQILGQIENQTPVRGISGAFVNFLWVEDGKRRDKDNIAFAKKFVLDALVSCGILSSDGWEGVSGFTDTFAVDKGKSKVVVGIHY